MKTDSTYQVAEEEMNNHAKEGWRLVTIPAIRLPQGLSVLMERELPIAEKADN